MMDSIASMAMSMKSAEIATQYSLAVTKKSMDSMEEIAQNLLEMLPDAPRGQYIDTYA